MGLGASTIRGVRITTDPERLRLDAEREQRLRDEWEQKQERKRLEELAGGMSLGERCAACVVFPASFYVWAMSAWSLEPYLQGRSWVLAIAGWAVPLSAYALVRWFAFAAFGWFKAGQEVSQARKALRGQVERTSGSLSIAEGEGGALSEVKS